MCKEASPHDVLKQLGVIDKMQMVQEKKVLQFSSFLFSEQEGCSFRKLARCISTIRNMPIATWSNTNGGFHCGFFLYRGYSFEHVLNWIKEEKPFSNLEGENMNKIALRLFNFLYETDTEEKYEIYWFS